MLCSMTGTVSSPRTQQPNAAKPYTYIMFDCVLHETHVLKYGG